MAPNFADDGFLAGLAQEVLRALKHCKRVMPSLGLCISRLVVSPAAGAEHDINLSEFPVVGCVLAESGNIEVLKSPCGDADFCKEFCSGAIRKHSEAFAALRSLEVPHVAYYLLRWSVNASRMHYLSRATPSLYCREALETFDLEIKQTFIEFPGLGLRLAVAVADAAYLGSRADTHDLCASIRTS